MKLNFWQWLGVALLVLGIVVFGFERKSKKPAPNPAPVPGGTTQPAK